MYVYIYIYEQTTIGEIKNENNTKPKQSKFWAANDPKIQNFSESVLLVSLDPLQLANLPELVPQHMKKWRTNDQFQSWSDVNWSFDSRIAFSRWEKQTPLFMVSKRKGIVAGNSLTRIRGWSRGSLRFRLFCFILFIIVIHQFYIWSIILLCCQSFRLTLETKKDSDLRHSDATLHRDVVAKRSAGSSPHNKWIEGLRFLLNLVDD